MPAEPPLAERATALASAGRFADAYRLLTSPDASRDPDSLFTLALWRLSGAIVRRDLSASRDLFRRAAEAGHAAARDIYIAFVANGTGAPPDWPGALNLLTQDSAHSSLARRQLELIGRMDLSPAGDPLRLPAEEQLSERPHVFCFRSLFSQEDCDFLAAQAGPSLQPSVVVDPASGRLVQNPVRTSDAMAFPYTSETPAVHALNRRLAAATRTEPSQGEPLQILRYRPGQEYRPHSDAIAGDPNQRIMTALVYLTEEYEGGETMFLSSGLRFKGRRGDALIFRNVLPDGRADPEAQHAGLPVTAGEKLIASRWIRAKPFFLPPPRPALDV